MRERFVVMTAVSELRRIFSSRDLERGFVTRVAFAENDQAHIVREKPIEERHEEIEAFFWNKPRDHSEHWARRRGREPQPIEKQIPADSLAFQISLAELTRKQMIRFRIPTPVIGAVKNREEAMGVFAQNNVELATTLRSKHLAPVTLAHRRDFVGEHDPGLEQVEPAAELDAVRLEISLR